jgi:hypothetical protein
MPAPPWPKHPAPPYGQHYGTPSYEVCSCCGFEFGNDDDPGTAPSSTFEQYRQDWIRRGNPWFDERPRPANWSLEEQLRQAGINEAE